MSNWDTPDADDDWKNAGAGGGGDDAFGAPKVEAGDTFFDGVATGDRGGEGGDRPPPGPCNKCKQEGHMAKECPNSKCTSCNESGHSAGSCPNPKCAVCNEDGHIAYNCPTRVCRHCNETGHNAKDCEKKPPETCKNCGAEGHKAIECKNLRKMRHLGEQAATNEEIEGAWEVLQKADKTHDVDQFKDAFFNYARCNPTGRLDIFQGAFEDNDFYFTLVAVRKEILNSQTIVDLQGNIGKEFAVTFQSSLKGRRSKFANHTEGRFPKDKEENKERLKNAGFVQESFIPVCTNCNDKGHTHRFCPQEAVPKEHEAPVVKCVNCDEVGHRARDCTAERKQPRSRTACRNCGEEGHMATDCEKPRDASNVTCRKCEKTGHFSKDCPDAPKMTCRNCDEEGHRASECPNPRKVTCNNCGQEGHMRADCTEPRNPAMMKCRNCDEMGHTGKECPKPRDMSRVKCNNCDQLGHFNRNCPNPKKPEDNDDGGLGSGEKPSDAPELTQRATWEEKPSVDPWGAGDSNSGGGGGW